MDGGLKAVLGWGACLLVGFACAPMVVPGPRDEDGVRAAERTVAVSGRGEASAAPDRARLAVAIEVADKRPDVALAKCGAAVDALIEAMLASGIERTDITTRSYRLMPETIYDDNGRPTEQRRYRMTQGFDIHVDDLVALPSIVSAASEAGVNRIDDIEFSVADDAALRETARERAIEDARARAATLAHAVGQRLGSALSIAEGVAHSSPQPPMYARSMAMESGAGAIPGGMFEETVSVEVVFALSDD